MSMTLLPLALDGFEGRLRRAARSTYPAQTPAANSSARDLCHCATPILASPVLRSTAHILRKTIESYTLVFLSRCSILVSSQEIAITYVNRIRRPTCLGEQQEMKIEMRFGNKGLI
jgi:hypothetical protein